MADDRNKIEVEAPITLPDELTTGVFATDLYVMLGRDTLTFDFVLPSPGSPSDRENLTAEVVSRVTVPISSAMRIKDLFDRMDFAKADEGESESEDG